jgi:hypothetical protein
VVKVLKRIAQLFVYRLGLVKSHVNAMRVFAKLKDGGVLGGNVTINAKQQE